jgi:hypothetical protein
MPQHWINHALISFYRSPGQPISVLDGVPIAIKDEIDCCPYPTTGKLIQDSIYIYIYIDISRPHCYYQTNNPNFLYSQN